MTEDKKLEEKVNTCPFAKRDKDMFLCEYHKKCNYQLDWQYGKYCIKGEKKNG